MTKIDKIYEVLIDIYTGLETPSVTLIAERCGKDPFRVLISTLISLRTKDAVTFDASLRLFKLADTPYKMIEIEANKIEKAIYPASFYRNKTKSIKDISQLLINKYDGNVPNDLDELLTFKGVGRKTANLVLVEGFGINAICVDSHVHRICNRFGILSTKTPDETEMVLRDILPEKYWIKWNEILVAFGQKICRPISPHCKGCPMGELSLCPAYNP